MTNGPGRLAVRRLGLALALVLSACASGPARPHEALRGGAEPLRSHFNRDVGRVRVVILAAPT